MVDFVDARSAICALISENWNANVNFIAGGIPTIYYPRIVYKTPIDPSKHWGRVSIQSVTSEQAAFCGYGKTADAKGKKYREEGLVFVQLFAPKSEIEAADEQDQIAKAVRDGFRGKSIPGKIWFRNARINDLEPEDEMLRLNVIAEYEYNEIT